ncbi:MAG: preprotein translocase subunit YajC [Chloroflexota bacterium]
MAEFAFLIVISVLVLGGYWSFFVYPRQREFNQRQAYVRTLAEGDEIITFGGVIGRVIDVDGEAGVVFVEIADGVVIRVVAASVVSEYDHRELAENAKRGLDNFETES